MLNDEILAEMASAANEPLLPELAPYVTEDGPFGPMLQHPLVYEMFLTQPGMTNKRYAAKKAAVEEALIERDWHTYVFLHERPYRFTALELVRAEHSADEVGTYWSLVADVWTDSENIWQHVEEWAELFAEADRTSMMDETDREAFDALPEMITIWRGAQRDVNEDGLSWSVKRERAEWFAKRFDQGGAVVIEARVPRDSVVAHFTGRGEHEIVVLPEDVEVICYHEMR